MPLQRGCGCGCLGPVLVIAALLALAALFHQKVLYELGAFLVANQAPQKSDAVVALAGDDYGTRVLTAGRLVREGWAPYALISGTPFMGTNQAELAIAYAQKEGFPASYFRPFERDMTSTIDETQAIALYLRREHIHRILLVTSNYHTRRAGLLMRRAAPEIEVRTVAAADKYFTPNGWWQTRGGQRTFFLEWSKSISTWLGY